MHVRTLFAKLGNQQAQWLYTSRAVELNIYMFRSWHSTYFKDTIDALYMPAFDGIPYSH